jgi:hypothetical protein
MRLIYTDFIYGFTDLTDYNDYINMNFVVVIIRQIRKSVDKISVNQ